MSWVKPSHIAELVEVAPATVLRWCHRKIDPLPHARVGGVIRISTTDFWAWWLKDYRNPRVGKIVDFKAG